jgi:hypothetical protein
MIDGVVDPTGNGAAHVGSVVEAELVHHVPSPVERGALQISVRDTHLVSCMHELLLNL